MAITIIKKDENVWQATSDTSQYIVEIDRNACIGAATCVAIASNIFELDSENKAIILEKEWDNDETLMASAQSCPVMAIILKDKVTGKVLFPVV